MNILLLGNGFDLYHKLPTTYLSFLKSTEYVVNNISRKHMTIGSVFNCVKDRCDAINDSYEQYASIYDNFELDDCKINEMASICSNNVWWKYFCSCYNEEVGWIDFEREIAKVIDEFDSFFSRYNETSFRKDDEYLVSQFDFFYNYVSPTVVLGDDCIIKSEFLTEKFHNSHKYILDKQKVVDTLFAQLIDFSKALSMYFTCFVDDPIKIMINQNRIISNKVLFNNMDQVISFNYTHTYEFLYNRDNSKEMIHIHGETDKSIVIGINSDENDNKNGNQLFIAFKKYLQMLQLDIQKSYEKFYSKLKVIDQSKIAINAEKVFLTIVGHSLDVTDKDIIEELFAFSDYITIYYHSQSAKNEYIKKLIFIFGREEYMQLIRKKSLQYVELL